MAEQAACAAHFRLFFLVFKPYSGNTDGPIWMPTHAVAPISGKETWTQGTRISYTGQQACLPCALRETLSLFSQTVCYTNLFEKTFQSKGPFMSLLPGHTEMWGTHGKLSPSSAKPSVALTKAKETWPHPSENPVEDQSAGVGAISREIHVSVLLLLWL